MKYTVALIAAAVGANAWAKNVTYVTETVDQYTTYCPGPTHITHGSKTWTITEATTLTITDCPCTITKPVTTTPVVVCHTCSAPAPPPPSQAPNNTVVAPPPPGGASPTGAQPTTAPPAVTAGAGKAMALSGAGLAGVVGLAAFVL